MKNHRQVLVFDVRRGFRNPVAKMGPAESLTTSEPAFKKSRYVRGSVKGHWFVRDEDLYDLRNTHQIVSRILTVISVISIWLRSTCSYVVRVLIRLPIQCLMIPVLSDTDETLYHFMTTENGVAEH